jgi:endoglucanase
MFIDVLKRLKGVKHPNTVFGVGTVQEEVGLRGAKTSAHLVNPDVCIVLEVGIADDVPGIKSEEKMGKLGAGPQLTIADRTMIPNRGLMRLMADVAKRRKIPLQYQAMMRGGTDGGPIHMDRAGVPTVYLGVPTRYIHSHAGIVHTDDYDRAVELLIEVIKRLDTATVKTLTP